MNGSFIIDSNDIGEAEELLTATYTKVRLSEQSRGGPTRTRVWRTPVRSLDVDDFEYSYDLQYSDVDPSEMILLCRVLKGAIEDHLPGHQPEMFTTGEAAAIGALEGTRYTGFFQGHAHTDISPADIAAATNVTPQALLNMFRVHRDCTPMAYVRRVRLHHVHQELVASDPETTSVTEIARRWGFHHIGLFMRRYVEAYGGEPDAKS